MPSREPDGRKERAARAVRPGMSSWPCNSIRIKVYPEVAPKVEYSLTEYGETLGPITEIMCDWGKKHMKKIQLKSSK
jgi:hypothetical protein